MKPHQETDRPVRPKMEGLCPFIQVFDMSRSLAFYRDLLGFTVVQRSSPGDDCDWAWLKLGDAGLMLNTRYEAGDRPPTPDPARVAAHDDTCFYIGAPNVEAMYAYLRSKGLDVKEPVVAPYGMKQLYLADPDGFGICFQWPSD
jgi:glyoxylase I family protein